MANESGIDLVLAEREIVRLLHRYCRAVDRLDLEELRSVYHPGAIDDHGSYSGPVDGFVKYIGERLPAVYLATQHSLSNILIEWQDEVAFAESYVSASHVIAADGGRSLFTFTGRYIDRIERRDGEWRIAHRKLLRTWENVQSVAAGNQDGSYTLAKPSPHTDGSRGYSDPSYDRV